LALCGGWLWGWVGERFRAVFVWLVRSSGPPGVCGLL